MSLAVPKLSVANPLADIVEEYGSARDLPATGWLTPSVVSSTCRC